MGIVPHEVCEKDASVELFKNIMSTIGRPIRVPVTSSAGETDLDCGDAERAVLIT